LVLSLTIFYVSMLRERNRELGVLTVVLGVVLLLTLRLWTSPIARGIVGRNTGGLLEFLLIPVFLVVVAIGITLFLWEPNSE